MKTKPPRPHVNLPTEIQCRGDYALGSACGRCCKCLEQWDRLTQEQWDEILRDRHPVIVDSLAPNQSKSSFDSAIEALHITATAIKELIADHKKEVHEILRGQKAMSQQIAAHKNQAIEQLKVFSAIEQEVSRLHEENRRLKAALAQASLAIQRQS